MLVLVCSFTTLSAPAGVSGPAWRELPLHFHLHFPPSSFALLSSISMTTKSIALCHQFVHFIVYKGIQERRRTSCLHLIASGYLFRSADPMRHALRVHVLPYLVCVLVVGWGLLAQGFGTKVEPGGRECFTEVVEAGGTLAFTFRVTDGGSFDINAVMTVTKTPPLKDITQASRVHFNEFFMARRDKLRTEVVNEWTRVSEGSQSFTAPSVMLTKHGLPAEVTVCFDNSFSTISPKWVRFTFAKRDVLEVDPDAVNKVEAEMEEKLHWFGSILFDLAQDADALRLTGEADRVKNDSISTLVKVGLVANICILVLMALYQYHFLTRFLRRYRAPAVKPVQGLR